MVDWQFWEQQVFTVVSFIIKWAAYPVILYVLWRFICTVITYANSLWVCGRPNEWVVIMRDGNFKQAGIGLSRFVSPFD